jgi:hypothetical protein
MRILKTACPIYQIKLIVLDIRPAIWRRILLRSDVTLVRLHKIIQALMGWYAYHLYQYKIVGRIHAPPREDDAEYGEGESVRIKMSTIFARGIDNMLYEYDFGDGWQVSIQLEGELPASAQKWDAIAIDGARRGPPEDSGGPYGYQRMLDVVRERTEEEYKEFRQWLGKGFDSEEFDLAQLNQILAESSESSYEKVTIRRFEERT